MSLCKNRTAQIVGEYKSSLSLCSSFQQKIDIFNSLLTVLKAAAPHTPIYYLGGTLRETGQRILLSANDLIPVIQKRIDYVNHSHSKTEAA